jgi:lysine 2,3-aminomutase
VIPGPPELEPRPWERDDPLGEADHEAAPGLIHTYPAKVLFLVTDRCATYCRYCTRSRMVGGGGLPADKRRWERALDYIRGNPGIRDVLLSGGDPLVLGDDRLGWLLDRLWSIAHVELIRIGTKIPAVMPQRVTPELTRVLRRGRPVWMSLHFTHPRELTNEAGEACARLADAGLPLMAQTVLLKGVNDDFDTLHELFRGLLRMRVKPYYLHQCDNVSGSWQFKTPVAHGLELVGALHGEITGYGVPLYMVDAPGGGGKVPLSPDFIIGRDGDDLLIRNRDGNAYRYPDPQT